MKRSAPLPLVLSGLAALVITGVLLGPVEQSIPTRTSEVHSQAGKRGAAVHRCGPECGSLSAKAVERHRVDRTESIAEMLAARDGDAVELSLPGAMRGAARITNHEETADGRRIVGARLADGATLHLVAMGEEWQGRLTTADREHMWVMAGDRAGGTMEKFPLSALMCAYVKDGRTVGGLPPVEEAGPQSGSSPGSGFEAAAAQPIFNSRPGANGVIYLDFDGETVSGTQWNTDYTGGAPIVAGASGFSNAQIQQIWETMAEDYKPFNVNVTTDRAVYDAESTNRKTMVIFTPDNEWFGQAGGVAYVDIFSSSFFDYPAWVFEDQLPIGGTPRADYSAEAGSHEAGHTLGLSHDGTIGPGAVEYYEGHGSGATGWAPIMGGSYQKTVSHWSKGEYNNASNTEDDLALIARQANGLGYVADDHADSTGSATPLTLTGGDGVSASGLIERTTDIDMFTVDTFGGTISITANNAATDPNLDIRLRLLNATGGEVAVADPSTSLDATLNVSVGAGTYYLEVDGVGTGTASTGWTDYASLGDYTLTGTVPQAPSVFAEILSPVPSAISLTEGTGLVLEGSAIGGTASWSIASAPPGGSAVFSAPVAESTRCDFSGVGFYAVRLEVDSGSETAEDLLFVSVEAPGAAKAYANRGATVDAGTDRNVYDVSVTLSPTVSDDGVPAPPALAYEWTVVSGNGSLSDPNVPAPDLDFGAPGPVALRLVVDDGEIKTFGETTVTGLFMTEVLAASNAAVSLLVPGDASVDGLWQALGFDDSGWQAGTLGVGYDVSNGPPSNKVFLPFIGTNVGSAMYGAAAGCYVRVPFTISQAERVLQLKLRMNHDDAFVAYINGTEVARDNSPAGTPAWDSLALSNRSDQDALAAQEFTITLPPGVLVDGANVLALHGMNSGIANNEREFLLGAELEATLKESPYEATVAVVTDPLLQNPNDDPDGDGIDNLTEHAGGTDPMTEDGYLMMLVEPGVNVRLLLPAIPPDDVRYELQQSDSLADPSWTTVASRDGAGAWTGQQPASADAGGSYEEHVFARTTVTRDFYRLKLTLIVP